MSFKSEISLKCNSSFQNDGYVPNGHSIINGGMATNLLQPIDVSDYGDDDCDPLFIQERKCGLVDEDLNDAAEKGDLTASRKSNSGKWPQRPEQLLKHVCAKCGMEFGKEIFLEQHLENLHSELHTAKDLKFVVISPSDAECQICGEHINHNSVRDLQEHHFIHLPYNSYKCKCHNYCFHDKQAGLKHLKFHAQQGMARKAEVYEATQVEIRDASLVLEDGTNYDPLYPETAVRYMCPECGQNFNSGDEWKEHCDTVHAFRTMDGLNMTRLEGLQVKCNECSTIITSKSDNYKLRRHKVTHSPFKAFHCKLCIYGRKRKEDVLQHIRCAHGHRGENYF